MLHTEFFDNPGVLCKTTCKHMSMTRLCQRCQRRLTPQLTFSVEEHTENGTDIIAVFCNECILAVIDRIQDEADERRPESHFVILSWHRVITL